MFHIKKMKTSAKFTDERLRQFECKLNQVEKRIPFPERLYEAVNKSNGRNSLMRWTADGRGFVVDETRFERDVMTLFPGLVQVPSFANLRRQLRAYNFEWQVLDTDELVFHHPCFSRDQPDLLRHVYTRRKTSDRKFESIIKGTKALGSSMPSSPGGRGPVVGKVSGMAATDSAGLGKRVGPPLRRGRRCKRRKPEDGGAERVGGAQGNKAGAGLQRPPPPPAALTAAVGGAGTQPGAQSLCRQERGGGGEGQVEGRGGPDPGSSARTTAACDCKRRSDEQVYQDMVGQTSRCNHLLQGSGGSSSSSRPHPDDCPYHVCVTCGVRWVQPPLPAVPQPLPHYEMQGEYLTPFYYYPELLGVDDYGHSQHYAIPHPMAAPLLPAPYPLIMRQSPTNHPPEASRGAAAPTEAEKRSYTHQYEYAPHSLPGENLQQHESQAKEALRAAVTTVVPPDGIKEEHEEVQEEEEGEQKEVEEEKEEEGEATEDGSTAVWRVSHNSATDEYIIHVPVDSVEGGPAKVEVPVHVPSSPREEAQSGAAGNGGVQKAAPEGPGLENSENQLDPRDSFNEKNGLTYVVL